MGDRADVVEEKNAFARSVFDGSKGRRIDAPVVDAELGADAIEELQQLGYIK